MFLTIMNLLIFAIMQQTLCQDLANLGLDGIPDDVELLSERDGATGKLAMPFNRGYSSYPVVVLQPVQNVK